MYKVCVSVCVKEREALVWKDGDTNSLYFLGKTFEYGCLILVYYIYIHVCEGYTFSMLCALDVVGYIFYRVKWVVMKDLYS